MKELSVAQLNKYLKGVIDDELVLQNIQVFGEIYEFSISGNNSYITLKEDEYILSCVWFGNKKKIEKGINVLINGSVSFFSKQGKINFIIQSLKPIGKGNINEEYQRLKEQLKNEGIFDNHKQLPRFIKKVAIITSQTGAVIHDFISVLGKFHPYIIIDLYSVKVQGENSDKEIVQAIQGINKLSDIDVIVIARGGGSANDLSSFDTEIVARSVYNSKIPVISAVGHQTDYTLCDFSSSIRAGTPSIAGEIIAKNNQLLIDHLYALFENLQYDINFLYHHKMNLLNNNINKIALLSHKLSSDKEKILIKLSQLMIQKLNDKIVQNKILLKEYMQKIYYRTNSLYSEKESLFNKECAILDSVSPLKVLSNGYAKIYKNGQAANFDNIDINDNIEILLQNGTIDAKVVDKKNR